MGKSLIWSGDYYKSNQSKIEGKKLLRIVFPLCLIGMAILVIVKSKDYGPVSAALGIAAYVAWASLGNKFSDLTFRLCLNRSYYESMQHALSTTYPHGIAFILRNILSTLKIFNITGLPYRDKWYEFTIGWPNQAILREAADAAEYLSTKWNAMEPAEKSMAMAQIRNMIQSEVFYLSGDITQTFQNSPRVYQGPNVAVNDNLRHQNLYVYYYDEDDYRRNVKCSGNKDGNITQDSIDTNAASNSKASPSQNFHSVKKQNNNTSQIRFKEFIETRPSLQYLDEQEQRNEYHRYLSSDGVPPQSNRNANIDEDVW